MTCNEIRSKFLEFFQSKAHTIVPSAPMVVKNDPTLMFTNAGMNQFKDIFLGNTSPKIPRIADSQKCLRVSGKHNDLEEVGKDTYHHTMFEMLGNWSFGDYFKKEAIDWAWEFITEWMKIDADRLYATVFEGNPEDGVPFDEEAFNIWKRHLPEAHILLGNKKDNFWEMGDTGPCGPCSELHIDLREAAEREKIAGAQLVNKDNPLVIEIWNLVFIQYNRLASGELTQLSSKHIDTGMGFERLCMVVQNKKSNYDTDVFQPLIRKIAATANLQYGENQKVDVAIRVIADHMRAVSFAIADGQLPSNTGAGYVIRRILRRAVRYGYTFLNFKQPFMSALVNDLVQQMGTQFPELYQQQTLIEKVIFEEENAFLKTLELGIIKFENYRKKLDDKKEIDGAFAFELFDTYGFPIDLTQLIASENDLTVDMKGFQEGLAAQKQRSRAAAAKQTDDWVELIHDEIQTQFVGYDVLSCEARIVKYRSVTTKGKKYFQIVLDKTPFYAESGGQVGDQGTLSSINEQIDIYDTVKENNLIIHSSTVLPDNVQVSFTAKVNEEIRLSTQNNHSATHLIHFALRKILGTHVEQKGSYVSSEKLRFDFSHFAKLTPEELHQTEMMVNAFVRRNFPLDEKRDVPIDEARNLGAMALFGEKYGDKVRVIRFGNSIELCGGTHTSATGNIGLVKLVSESAIAAGVRRIEAVTGKYAEEYVQEFQSQVEDLKQIFNSPIILQAVQKLMSENDKLKKELEVMHNEKLASYMDNLKQKMIEANINIINDLTDINPDSLKQAAYQLRTNCDNLAIILGTVYNEKPGLVVALSDDLVAKGMNASALIREGAKFIQGGGGGQPSLATAGGKNPDGLENAVKVIVEKIFNN